MGEDDSLANFRMGSIEMLIGMFIWEIAGGGLDGISKFTISGVGAVILQDENMIANKATIKNGFFNILEIIDWIKFQCKIRVEYDLFLLQIINYEII